MKEFVPEFLARNHPIVSVQKSGARAYGLWRREMSKIFVRIDPKPAVLPADSCSATPPRYHTPHLHFHHIRVPKQ